MRRVLVCSLAGAAAALLLAPAARADEDARSLALSLGYVGLSLPKHSPNGGALALDYHRGVTDAMALRGAVLGAVVEDEKGSHSAVGQAIIGLTYSLDVLKYVPYVDLGVGYALVGAVAGNKAALHPELEIGLGLDVMHDRSISYGPFVRLAAYVDSTTILTAGVRLAYHWGFF